MLRQRRLCPSETPLEQGRIHVTLMNLETNELSSDTFVGYYAMEFVRQNRTRPFQSFQWDIRKAVELGCKAAAKTISEIGAQEAIPWADEIEC
jgi:hypothetical protein